MMTGPVQHAVPNAVMPAGQPVSAGPADVKPALIRQIPRPEGAREQVKWLQLRGIAEFDPFYPAVACSPPETSGECPPETRIPSGEPSGEPSVQSSKRRNILESLAVLCSGLFARFTGSKKEQSLIATSQPAKALPVTAQLPAIELYEPLAPEQVWKPELITREDIQALEELRAVAAEGGKQLDNSVAERVWRLLIRMAQPFNPACQRVENVAEKVISRKRLETLQTFLKGQLKKKVRYEINENLGRRAIQLLLHTGASAAAGPVAPALPVILQLWRVADFWREGRALYFDKNPIPALKDMSVNLLPRLVMKLIF